MLLNALDMSYMKVSERSTSEASSNIEFFSVIVANPLGVVGVLSAFNFPVAVYGWFVILIAFTITFFLKLFRNLALSLAAGNATIWKPSPTTPLCSIAVSKIIADVLERNNIPGAVASLVTGGKETGMALVKSKGVELSRSQILKFRMASYILWSFFHW